MHKKFGELTSMYLLGSTSPETSYNAQLMGATSYITQILTLARVRPMFMVDGITQIGTAATTVSGPIGNVNTFMVMGLTVDKVKAFFQTYRYTAAITYCMEELLNNSFISVGINSIGAFAPIKVNLHCNLDKFAEILLKAIEAIKPDKPEIFYKLLDAVFEQIWLLVPDVVVPYVSPIPGGTFTGKITFSTKLFPSL